MSALAAEDVNTHAGVTAGASGVSADIWTAASITSQSGAEVACGRARRNAWRTP